MSFSNAKVPQNCKSYRKIKFTGRFVITPEAYQFPNKHSTVFEVCRCLNRNMNNSRRSAKENPFEWNNPSSSANSVKAEILEIQRQQENKQPTKDEFKFTEPRVSHLSLE